MPHQRRMPMHRSHTFALAALACTLLALGIVPGRRAESQQATPIPTLTAIAWPTPAPSPTPAASPTPTGPQDGDVIALDVIYSTPRSTYYALTYLSDGLRVRGYLGAPNDPGPHPAIIHNRGGYDDRGALSGGEIVPYVEAGYVAVASQYRGNGGGEGREDFGGADVHDVTALIRLLQNRPDVDPDRIGMFGGSRGGMMAFIAIKQETVSGQNRIQVLVTVGAISDLFAWDRERGGALAGELWIPLIGGTPAQLPEAFEARSAVYWPELITVPVLMLHGEADRDVSIEQTRRLAGLLLDAGGDVEVITYPGGDHSLSALEGGFPDALAWFDYYLSSDGVDRSYAAHEDQIRAVQAWFRGRTSF